MNRHTALLGVLLLLSLAGNIATMLRPESPPGPATSPPPAIAPAPVVTPDLPAYPATVASPAPEPADTAILRRKVEALEEQLKRTTEELLAAKERQTRMEIPQNQEAERKLLRIIDAKFDETPMIDVMEALRKDAGLEFDYDPALRPKLERVKITMAMSSVQAKVVLKLLSGMAGDFTFDFINGQVWIREKEKK